MQIKYLKTSSLKPYEKNAKKHDKKQVDNVAESIKQFGFVQPVVVDKNNNIIIGHCRLEAAKKLNLDEVPCVMVDDLTDEQVRKLRLLDNKLNESDWDIDLIAEEILDLDFDDFDVDWELPEDEETETYEQRMQEFQSRMESGELSEDDEEYQEFLQKFEEKKTTDDCYTPPLVYEAVADYVAEEYGLNKDNFVRPFVPGGDYQAEKYKKTDIVVDNPPFSIMAEILDFYNAHGIKYFLFAPHLTLFSGNRKNCACIIVGIAITYENGAKISTSFITNLEDCAFRSAPKLYKAINNANSENLKQTTKSLPVYEYPLNVITSTMIAPYSRLGINFKINKDECQFIRQLDCQKESGNALFGGGFLISDSKKDERIVAEREKAEREKAEREKATVWELSDRELAIIEGLK